MANTRFQLKRSTVSGVTPTTSDIASGELGINLADKKLFSSNGSVVFELGSNLTNVSVTSNLTIESTGDLILSSGAGIYANGSVGTSGQVLTSNGTSVYWDSAGGAGTVTSVNTANGLTGGPITTSGTISVQANDGIVANSSGLFVNTSYIGTLAANSAGYLGNSSGTLANISSWVTGNAATAYSNAANYADSAAGNAYSNATVFASNASNINTGTLPNARLDANVVNTSANFTITGVHTYNANLFVNAATLSVGNATTTSTINTTAFVIANSVAITANGSTGSAGKVLTSNGTGVYWGTPSGGGNSSIVSQQFTANGTANTFTITGGYTPGAIEVYLNGIKQLEGVDVDTTSGSDVQFLYTPSNDQKVDVFGYLASVTTGVVAVGTGDGLTGGTITTIGTISVRANNGITANGGGLFVTQGTGTVVNATGVHVNSSYIATLDANSATYLGNSSGTVANIASWITGNSATAYSNATSYADTAANSAAATAYSNAVANAAALYQTTAGLSANVATLTSNNSTNFGGLSLATVQSQITGNADTAYTNATTFASNASNITTGTLPDGRLSSAIVNTSGNFTVAGNINFTATNNYFTVVNVGANVIVNTTHVTVGNTSVYTSIDSTSVNTGTISANTLSTLGNANVGGSLVVSGNLTVSGNVTVIGANNLSVVDNMIYLNANSTLSDPDLGFVGNYNDGTYHHAGFFRDASDGIWKVFDGYLPEPDASPYIDTSNNSFNIAPFQANNIYIGNTTVYGTINATSFDGSANSATYLGNSSGTVANIASWITGNAATAYTNGTIFASNASNINTGTLANARLDANVVNTSAAFTITGAHTYQANITIGNTTVNTQFSNAYTLYSNSSTTTALGLADLRIGNTTTNVVISNTVSTFGGNVSITGSANAANVTAALFTGNLAGTASNATNLNSQPGSYYTNATNITTGTLPMAQLGANVVNTSGSFTFTDVQTYNANLIIGSTSELLISNGAGIQANGSFGTAGQLLASNGTSVYWTSTGSGASSTRQTFTANATVNAVFTVTSGYTVGYVDVFKNGVKLINGTEVTVTDGSTVLLASQAAIGDIIDVVGFLAGAVTANLSAVVSQQFTANGTANSFTITGGYIPNAIEVYVSGVKQVPNTNVFVASGNTVNFAVPPLNGQIVDVYGYQTIGGITTNGTVTSISSGNGLTGGPIATTGTLSIDTSGSSDNQVLTSNGTTVSWSAKSKMSYRTITANTTVLATDDLIMANGTLTITLPAASTVSGQQFYIKNINSTNGVITVLPSGSELIDGYANATIRYYNTMFGVISVGTGWVIF